AAPRSCRGATGCGLGVPCRPAVGTCSLSGERCFETCAPEAGECLYPGLCSTARRRTFCSVTSAGVAGTCPGDSGPCLRAGECARVSRCNSVNYTVPEVSIDRLPANSAAIADALVSRGSIGNTPTLPAVSGVLQLARAHRDRHPRNKIVMVLATDGLPSACDPSVPDDPERDPSAGIEAPAAVLAQGRADGIESLIVGVFERDQEVEARTNLSRLAQAGGTGEAFVVTTDDDVSERLFELLSSFRQTIRSCVYAIPDVGSVPEPNALQVHILANGTRRELERVDGQVDCASVPAGFFFEQDLEGGARPGFIELCPASCAEAEARGAQVHMSADCRI
ncbi:MAG: hypothetical protein AAF938_21370, partial [Myxococcota bacterium]